jgi:hypothetical protein
MVNDRFPKPSRYGFEMVHAPEGSILARESSSIENLQRIQFPGFFTNFRRIKLKANTCDLSTAVTREVCLRDQRNGKERDDRGRKMFFLLRLTFWLGLVLVLLPRDKTPESDKLPQVGASEAVQAATAAVSDMTQFCKRQPAACEVGGQAATVIGQRAADGARKVYSIITDKADKADTSDKAEKTEKAVKKAPGAEKSDKKAPDHTGSIGNVADAQETMIVEAPRDTLTADDLALEWRMPTAN